MLTHLTWAASVHDGSQQGTVISAMCSFHTGCSRPACFDEQVYKGILRSTGESVAVKVQRPGIGDHIAVDMLLLRRLMAVIDKNQTIVSLWHGL